jgi:hypothetical protein
MTVLGPETAFSFSAIFEALTLQPEIIETETISRIRNLVGMITDCRNET